MFRDKLGREINVGDLVAIGTYSNRMDIIRVTSFSKNGNLVGRTFWLGSGLSWGQPDSLDNFRNSISKPPDGWLRWTGSPENKCIILSKGK